MILLTMLTPLRIDILCVILIPYILLFTGEYKSDVPIDEQPKYFIPILLCIVLAAILFISSICSVFYYIKI